MSVYYTDIPGNYVKSWLNNFSKGVEEGRYKKVAYSFWRELVRLSEQDKLKFKCKMSNDGAHVEEFTIGILPISPKTNYFGRFLEISMLEPDTEKDRIFPNINWHKEDDEVKHVGTLNFDASGNLYIDGKLQDGIEIQSIHTSADGSYTVKTNSGNYYGNNNIWTNATNTTVKPDNIATNSTVIKANDYATGAVTIDYGNWVTNDINTIKDDVNKLKKAVYNTEEKNKMNTNDMFNFDFGPVSDSKIRMSMYGYAIPNSEGKYVAYDIEHERMMDVQILNFNCTGMFYKIPKPIHKVTYGDVVFHNGVPMFVTDIYDDHTRLVAIDPKEGTEKTILPAHSPFGFDYIVTLVSLMDSFDVPADEENPFGNMLPLIMMSNGKTSDQTLPLLFMMNGKMDMDNPLMLMALCGNNLDTNNPLMVMAMMKMFDK